MKEEDAQYLPVAVGSLVYLSALWYDTEESLNPAVFISGNENRQYRYWSTWVRQSG